MKNNGKLSISFMIAYTDELNLIEMATRKGSKLYTFEKIVYYQNCVKDFLKQANEDNTHEDMINFYKKLEWKYEALIYILERI